MILEACYVKWQSLLTGGLQWSDQVKSESLLQELRISLTAVLSGSVQLFKEEFSNLPVGGVGELLARL